MKINFQPPYSRLHERQSEVQRMRIDDAVKDSLSPSYCHEGLSGPEEQAQNACEMMGRLINVLLRKKFFYAEELMEILAFDFDEKTTPYLTDDDGTVRRGYTAPFPDQL